MAIKDLLFDLAHDHCNLPNMNDDELLRIIRKHGFELCDAKPVGWAALQNVTMAQMHGGVIGVGSEEGAVVFDGETWHNANQPIYLPCSAPVAEAETTLL